MIFFYIICAIDDTNGDMTQWHDSNQWGDLHSSSNLHTNEMLEATKKNNFLLNGNVEAFRIDKKFNHGQIVSIHYSF